MEIQSDIINHVEKFIDKNRGSPGVNFRFILGKYSEHFGFEPHIFHKEKYEEIKLFLESCVSLENVIVNENEKNSENENEINSEIDSEIDSENENLILLTNDCYDLIITIDFKVTVKSNLILNRKTTSFFKKNHVFVLSIITTSLDEIYYMFEIVAIIPLHYTSRYISHSSLLKICDIITKLNNSLQLYFYTLED